MKIHKEGYKIIIWAFILLLLLNIVLFYFLPDYFNLLILATIGSVVLMLLILQFFRSPARKYILNEKQVLAPADGKVVVVEEVKEDEFFNGEKRKQISIFMSPVNVHVNWNPVSGIVKYFKYHPGKYLVAWHPKSSTENERTTIVVETEGGVQILLRQIAGAMAKRIIWYLRTGDKVNQGEELGFIRFGSRVDVLLPPDAEIKVGIGDKTRGRKTVLAELK